MDVIIDIRLREVRTEKHLTIIELAELSGVSKSHISEIENGKQMPSIQILCLLAIALEIEPEELYTYKII